MSSAGTDWAAATARHLEGSGSVSPVTHCTTCAGDSPAETLTPPPSSSTAGAASRDHRQFRRISWGAALASRAKFITHSQCCLPPSPPSSPGPALLLPFCFRPLSSPLLPPLLSYIPTRSYLRILTTPLLGPVSKMLSVAQQLLQAGANGSPPFTFIAKVNIRPGVWVKANLSPLQDTPTALLHL